MKVVVSRQEKQLYIIEAGNYCMQKETPCLNNEGSSCGEYIVPMQTPNDLDDVI